MQANSIPLPARPQCIEQHIGLVATIAHRYAGLSAWEDLLQSGTLGLLEATARFDPQRGVAFSTYAVPIIRRHILEALAHEAPVRLPRALRSRARAVRQATAVLEQRLQRPPLVGDLAAALGWSVAQVHQALAVASQDQPLPLADTLPAASTPATPHEHDVTALLAVLDERSREMVVLRYGLEGRPCLSANEIAAQMGVSDRRVRQVLQQALGRMRRAHRADSTIERKKRPHRTKKRSSTSERKEDGSAAATR